VLVRKEGKWILTSQAAHSHRGVLRNALLCSLSPHVNNFSENWIQAFPTFVSVIDLTSMENISNKNLDFLK
jgi:hypothetical protein